MPTTTERATLRTGLLVALALALALCGALALLLGGDEADEGGSARRLVATAKGDAAADPEPGAGDRGADRERLLDPASSPDAAAPPAEGVSAALPPDATGISGRLIGRDGKPLANAEVVLDRTVLLKELSKYGVTAIPGKGHGRYVKSATSGEDGRFAVIDLIAAPGYRLRARTADGLLGQAGDVEVLEKVVWDVGDVAMRRAALVSGTVRTEAGAGIEGAEIQFGWSWNDEPTVSGEGGRFDAGAVAPEKHDIRVKAKGYALREQMEREFIEGDVVRDLELVLVRAAPIAGRVVDKSGKPIQSAWINVNRRTQDDSVFGWFGDAAQSDSDGRFEFASLAEGVYELYASATGYDSVQQEVTAGGSAPLELALEKTGGVEGMTVDATSGQPVLAEEVRLLWNPPWRGDADGAVFEPYWRGAESDVREDGTFSIGISDNGRFKVQASADGFAAASESEPFEFKLGSQVAGVLVRMEPGIELSATVLDAATRAPVHGAILEVYPFVEVDAANTGLAARLHQARNQMRLARATTAANGVAALKSLSPGRFAVTVRKPGYCLGGAPDVQIVRGVPPTPVEILVSPGGAIAGVVKNDRAEPEPGMKLFAAGSRGESGQAVSLADGAYRIENLTAGRYSVRAETEDDSLRQVGYFGSSSEGESEQEVPEEQQYPLVVEEGKTTAHDVSIQRVAPGSLAGSVLLNGQPAAGIQVMANLRTGANGTDFDWGWQNAVKTDNAGAFKMRRLKPGSYAIVVNRTWSRMYAAGAAEVNSGLETQVTLDVGLGGVSGRVVDAEGRPLADATVTVARSDAGAPENPWGSSGEAECGDDGAFAVEELQSGTYRVEARCRGFRRDQAEAVQVSARRATSGVELRLTPGGWLHVTVRGIPDGPQNPLRFNFSSADGQTQFARWSEPESDGTFWVEAAGAKAEGGTLSVMRRGRDRSQMKGSVTFTLPEGANAELEVELTPQ